MRPHNGRTAAVCLAVLVASVAGCSTNKPSASTSHAPAAATTPAAVAASTSTPPPAAEPTAPTVSAVTPAKAPSTSSTVTKKATVRPTTHATAHSTPTPTAKTCESGLTSAVIGGVHKCIKANQLCESQHRDDYLKYGFVCAVKSGQWLLTKKP